MACRLWRLSQCLTNSCNGLTNSCIGLKTAVQRSYNSCNGLTNSCNSLTNSCNCFSNSCNCFSNSCNGLTNICNGLTNSWCCFTNSCNGLSKTVAAVIQTAADEAFSKNIPYLADLTVSVSLKSMGENTKPMVRKRSVVLTRLQRALTDRFLQQGGSPAVREEETRKVG